jgi:hypothetical protein
MTLKSETLEDPCERRKTESKNMTVVTTIIRGILDKLERVR